MELNHHFVAYHYGDTGEMINNSIIDVQLIITSGP